MTSAKSRNCPIWLVWLFAILSWPAGTAEVTYLCDPPSAFSSVRNSDSSAVKFAVSFGLTWLPRCPPGEPGYSQSMSKPSKIPAATPAPPWTPSCTGRLPLMNMSMQEDTNFLRDASVAATSEKYFEYVQPPSDSSTFRFECRDLSFLSWLKLPASGWLNVSATPSTLVLASYPFWTSANSSSAPSPA